MKILYFAWLRQRIGAPAEEVSLPDEVRTVGELVTWLGQRGPGHAKAFEKAETVRAAVNFEYVQFDHPVADDDEVAFFPPVTGG